ncbi:tRNA dimethylallyltransferase isoform X2 [Brevipalpus obovatus]
MLGKLIAQFLMRFSKRHKIMDVDKPVVFILGPTGVGKTKLSIELAQKFDGEIISADSMQVYRNLDIITNKVTNEEMQGVPHHMINFVDPLKFFTSVDYRNQTLPIIKNVLDRRKVPIVVGGTMYWIECLLYDVLIRPEKNETISLQVLEEVREDSLGDEFSLSNEDITKETLFSNIIEPKYLRAVPAENLHKILQEIDPERAQFIHPSEKRKTIRSLQIYQQTGKTHTDWLNEQKNIGSHLGGPLRFKNSLILLLTCDEDVLNERINKRIEQMLDMGLVQELLDFHDQYNLTRLESNI